MEPSQPKLVSPPEASQPKDDLHTTELEEGPSPNPGMDVKDADINYTTDWTDPLLMENTVTSPNIEGLSTVTPILQGDRKISPTSHASTMTPGEMGGIPMQNVDKGLDTPFQNPNLSNTQEPSTEMEFNEEIFPETVLSLKILHRIMKSQPLNEWNSSLKVKI